jgi:hypothetical protein
MFLPSPGVIGAEREEHASASTRAVAAFATVPFVALETDAPGVGRGADVIRIQIFSRFDAANACAESAIA